MACSTMLTVSCTSAARPSSGADSGAYTSLVSGMTSMCGWLCPGLRL
jgi:hypothetical protein